MALEKFRSGTIRRVKLQVWGASEWLRITYLEDKKQNLCSVEVEEEDAEVKEQEKAQNRKI